jgi:hypothetical protein
MHWLIADIGECYMHAMLEGKNHGAPKRFAIFTPSRGVLLLTPRF